MDSIRIERNGVKAEVIERYLPEFLADGWLKVTESVDESNAELKVTESDSKDEIEALIKTLFGIDLDKRGSLETIKEKALAIIRESKPE